MPEPLLALCDLRAGYGNAVVLDGIALEVADGGSLAVLEVEIPARMDPGRH